MYYNVIMDSIVVKSRCQRGTALRWASSYAATVSGMRLVKVVDETGHKIYSNL